MCSAVPAVRWRSSRARRHSFWRNLVLWQSCLVASIVDEYFTFVWQDAQVQVLLILLSESHRAPNTVDLLLRLNAWLQKLCCTNIWCFARFASFGPPCHLLVVILRHQQELITASLLQSSVLEFLNQDLRCRDASFVGIWRYKILFFVKPWLRTLQNVHLDWVSWLLCQQLRTGFTRLESVAHCAPWVEAAVVYLRSNFRVLV